MSEISLWEPQQESITALKQSLRSGAKRPLLVSPTGSGKTHIACNIITGAVSKGNDVLFFAPRRELIYQAADRLQDHGISSGIIMAGEPRKPSEPVQVASFDTFHSRGVRSDRMILPTAKVVIVDEAHLSIAKTRLDILTLYSQSIIIGLTATPARGDGRGLGEVYDDMVIGWNIRRLTEAGYLVPARYFAPSKPDLSKIKSTKSDYVTKDLGKAMDQPKLIGEILRNWLEIAPDRQTVVFCVTKDHAMHVFRQYEAAGISVGYLDSDTKLSDRQKVLEGMATGRIQVLVNIFVATYGWDCPAVSCVVIARPTKNIALYLQLVGRGLRTSPGKEDCIVIDHSGVVDNHGFVDEDIPWTLDSDTDVREKKKEQEQEKQEPKSITCEECGYVFKSQRVCPKCGHEMVRKGKPIPTHKATLKELKRDRKSTIVDKQKFWNECIFKAKHKKLKCGAAAHMYRQRFGVWPKGLELMPKGKYEWNMTADKFIAREVDRHV